MAGTATAVDAAPQSVHPHTSLSDTPNLSGKFVAVKPVRVLDTRDGTGTGGLTGPVGPNSSAILDVSNVTGNPSIAATAVVLNVTVTNPTASSFVSVFPDGFTRPSTSNLNFNKGQTIPNLVTVPVGNGKIDFFNHVGNTDIVADLFGYYTLDESAATFATLPPTRILDTRSGTGVAKAPVGAGKTISLQVEGVHGVPSTGVSAVVLNVTVTDPTATSFLSVFPDGTGGPGTSNLNFLAKQTTANSVIVPVGADGKVDFFNHIGSVDVIADISGYFVTNAAGTVPHADVYDVDGPTRIMDTRSGTGVAKAPVGAGRTVSLKINGVGDLPPAGVKAVVLNLTVTDPTASSFVTAFPDGTAVPGASSINFGPGQTAANLVVVPVGADGKVDFFNHVGSVDVVADILGYYTSGATMGISSAGFTTSTVDASAGGAGVTVNWTVTDSNPAANVVFGDIQFRMAGAAPNTYVGQTYDVQYVLGNSFCCNGSTFVGGDTASSDYTDTFFVPQFADAATAHWVITLVTVTDDQGGSLVASGSDLNGVADTLTATEQIDTNLPFVQGVDFFANLAGGHPFVYDGVSNTGHYTLNVQDFFSGFWKGTLTLTGPGGRTLTAGFSMENVNGNETSNTCQGDIHQEQCDPLVLFPKGTPAGVWTVTRVTATDNAGTTATSVLSTAPITVGNDAAFSANTFKATPNPANNWRSSAQIAVSLKVSGAKGGISSIFVDASVGATNCLALSATPTANPDGSLSVPIRLDQNQTGCGVSGIAVVDGAGDVALYGQEYSAPDPGITVTRVPDTTAPNATSAALGVTTISQSELANRSIVGTVHVVPGIAPVNGTRVFVFDGSGTVVGQSGGGTSEGPDGEVTFDIPIPSSVAPGTYTIGFTLIDAGNLSTSYGPPSGLPTPGGPLQLTVTAG
ncbi:MAG TPA: hypothetical protein VFW65_30700 [Pseudonocardiaceae bacterium]|nr:hypothetical protein [Pseudonocardiaceae bacterium]